MGLKVIGVLLKDCTLRLGNVTVAALAKLLGEFSLFFPSVYYYSNKGFPGSAISAPPALSF